MADTESVMNDASQTAALAERAAAGDKGALKTLLAGVQDMVFNLSLRMLGSIPDAEDCAQEILIRIITKLSTFRAESSFSTWVFRIAVNHAQNYKKGMFCKYPLSFEYYGEDIMRGSAVDVPDMRQNVEEAVLLEELKLSCTNVMLQCLDAESRCIFILGTMFKIDSRIAADVMGITAEAYRQRLSRIKKKMASFLEEYCGVSGTGMCSCRRRIDYAISSRRLNPANPEYSRLERSCAHAQEFRESMEDLDTASKVFSGMSDYRCPETVREFLDTLLRSDSFTYIQKV